MLANGNGTERDTGRGALIVLEGLDRSGKTTQAKLLLEHLQKGGGGGHGARVQRFPDREEPTTGPAIDTFLRRAKRVDEDREAVHLLFSANRWLRHSRMAEELRSGMHLIVDRYSHSGIAYSLAKGMDRRWACQPEVGLLRPDLVLFFDVDPAKVSERGGFGREVMERSHFQELVYTKMGELFEPSYWRRIDANRPIGEVHEAVVGEVSRLLEEMARSEPPLVAFSADDFGI